MVALKFKMAAKNQNQKEAKMHHNVLLLIFFDDLHNTQ
jgi:hypothetical protein